MTEREQVDLIVSFLRWAKNERPHFPKMALCAYWEGEDSELPTLLVMGEPHYEGFAREFLADAAPKEDAK